MSETELREPTTAAGDALLTDVIQDHEAPSYHVIERIRRGILAIEAEARALASIPAEPERADEVAGLDAARLAKVLRTHRWHVADEDGYDEQEYDEHLRGITSRIATEYARLAPARDDTSGGAS